MTFESFSPFVEVFMMRTGSLAREELVQHLVYPQCKLFTKSTTQIEIGNAELNLLLSSGGSLDSTIRAIKQLDDLGVKVLSINELAINVRNILISPQSFQAGGSAQAASSSSSKSSK
jgi:hypothetical protein